MVESHRRDGLPHGLLSLLFFSLLGDSMDFDLNYAVEHGIIDVPAVRLRIEMEKRKDLIEAHPFKPWEGKDGKWYVYIPDEKKGRMLKKRTTQKAIEDVIVSYQKTLLDNPTIDDIFTEWNDYRLELKHFYFSFFAYFTLCIIGWRDCRKIDNEL